MNKHSKAFSQTEQYNKNFTKKKKKYVFTETYNVLNWKQLDNPQSKYIYK